MWLALLRSGWPYGLAFGIGLSIAGLVQQWRLDAVRADLMILQARVALANEGARLATEKAKADTADAQAKIDAITAELATKVGTVRTVDVVRRVAVRGVCQPADSQAGRAPKDQDPPVDAGAADPIAAPGVYRCVRLDDWNRWRDSVTVERNRLRDGHLAHQALSRALEAATDHIEIVE